MVARGRRSRADSRYVVQAARLAARLRQFREQAGLTQDQLAAQAKVSVATIRKIETGVVVEPGLFTVAALASALACGLNELVGQVDADAAGPPPDRLTIDEVGP